MTTRQSGSRSGGRDPHTPQPPGAAEHPHCPPGTPTGTNLENETLSKIIGRREGKAGGRTARPAQAPGLQEQLFPTEADMSAKARRPIVRPVLVVTRGRLESAVRCPNCGNWHRHAGLGVKRAPCGSKYDVRTRSAGKDGQGLR